MHSTSINSVSLILQHSFSLLLISFIQIRIQVRLYICIPLQGNILCLLSGVVLLLIESYWPIAYCWKIRQSRNFTMLGCYSCVLSVLIVSCVVALMATIAFSATMFQCFDLFSIGATIAMGVVIFIFVCSSVCCLCCCSNKIGRIC